MHKLIIQGTRLLAAAILLACQVPAIANQVIDEYTAKHKDGALFLEDKRLDRWRKHSSNRNITFAHIVSRGDRTTAYFHETGLWDGKPAEAYGIIMLFSADGKLTGSEWVTTPPDVYKTSMDLASKGQLADVGTTAVGLSAGLREANPLGVALLPLKYALHANSKTLGLHDCIKSRTSMGSVGWGAAAANVGTILGLGPAGILVGLIAGVGASDSVKSDAAVECAKI